jgi:PEP-CTERM motif
LFQDVTIGLAGDVDYGFSHINRADGTDVMRVLITYLGADGVIGGTDDEVKINRQFSTTNNTSTSRVWNDFAVDNAFVSVAGGTYRFSFGAISAASGNSTEGNFLDNVRFGINAVPEPSSALLGAFGALALLRRRRN